MVYYYKKTEKKEKKRIAFNDILQLITILVSILTFCFTVISYIINQELIDKRKYYNEFYDERYKVLKSLAQAISEINANVKYHSSSTFSKTEAKAIALKTTVFDYSYLVVNKNQSSEDSILLNSLESYSVTLGSILNRDTSFALPDNETPEKLDSLGKEISIQCGNILYNEKNKINSISSIFSDF